MAGTRDETLDDLSPRERNILRVIVQSYVETARPVGSRTLTGRYRLGVSPATVRNVMVDLEERGLVFAPHTSAGRVPTDRGYRLFVDRLMRPAALSPAEERSVAGVFEGVEDPRALVSRALHALSDVARQLVFALPPEEAEDVIEAVRVVALADGRDVLIVSSRGGTVHTKPLSWDRPSTESARVAVSRWATGTFRGLTLPAAAHILERAGLGATELTAAVLRTLEAMIERNAELQYGGTLHLTEQPEFERSESLRPLFQMLDADRGIFSRWVLERSADGAVSITIGAENGIEGMGAMSVVTARFTAGRMQGAFGVIGPTRMRYPKLVSLVRTVADGMARAIEA